MFFENGFYKHAAPNGALLGLDEEAAHDPVKYSG